MSGWCTIKYTTLNVELTKYVTELTKPLKVQYVIMYGEFQNWKPIFI